MFKIALSGKAGSGKDLAARLIIEEICSQTKCLKSDIKKIALANPVKEIAQIMFPVIKSIDLYGNSKNRANVILNENFTIRQLLLDIGTKFGRSYNDNIWLNVFDERIKNLNKHIIVTDCRFFNEIQHMKEKEFCCIRIKRDSKLKIDHITESGQDNINDSNFDYILDNNGSVNDLKLEITKIFTNISI